VPLEWTWEAPAVVDFLDADALTGLDEDIQRACY
jgi:hypothetical protein